MIDNRYWLLIFLLGSAYTKSERIYSIRRDLISGGKAPEFSIYDSSGKSLKYRIESHMWGFHKIDIVAHPSKQVIGKLENKVTFLLYEGNFQLLDTDTNEWTSGHIEQKLRPFNHKSIIQWKGKRIRMEHNYLSLTTTFRDDSDPSNLMAEYKLSVASLAWARRYTLKIYSDDVPDQVYMFGLAVRDFISATRSK